MINKIIDYFKNKRNIFKMNQSTNSNISKKAKIDIETVFGGRNVINKNVSLSKSTVGFATYIGQDSKFHKTNIGKFCSIASNVKLVSGNHPTSIFVSTHPIFFSSRKFSGLTFGIKESLFEEFNYVDKEKNLLCSIGNDVWIGENVIILNGVSIGDGAIIGTGSVVAKNVEPYSVVAGVPASHIKYRFKENEIDFLLKLKWWDRNLEWINENANLFRNIDLMWKFEGNLK